MTRPWSKSCAARLFVAAFAVGAVVCIPAPAFAASPVQPGPPTLPNNVTGKDGVKAYLLAVCEACDKAAADLKTDAAAYADLVKHNGDSPAAAAKAQPQQVADLVHKMRNDYERLDSYGYEYMEGIVAGVPSLVKYDVELDSGLPKSMAQAGDPVADVVIHAGDLTVDHEGSLNNFLIEPTVFGTHDRFTDGSATLPGFDKPVHLPNPRLIVALADYAVDGYHRLTADAKAWRPSDADCFQAIYNMTPTLAGYFDEWKQSLESPDGAAGGRFVAVSRVSDMRGIMSSVQLTWRGVRDQIEARDPALARSITEGYDHIMSFIDSVEAKDKVRKMNIQAIDALGSQAKDRADKVTVQIAQAAALANVNVESQ